MDDVSSTVCSRCGGSGHYSFNLVDGTVCYGCGGVGRIPKTPKGQKRIRPTAELDMALPGDIILHARVLYAVTRITWCQPRRVGWDTFNQEVHVTRLVDDKPLNLYRACLKEHPESSGYSTSGDGRYRLSFCLTPYIPTPGEIGQETTVTRFLVSPEQEQQAIQAFREKHPHIAPACVEVRQR